MARLALYVTPFEMREIKKQAGDVPISKWCKKRVLESMAMPSSTSIPKSTHDTPSRIPDVQPEPAIRTDGRRKSMPNRIVASLREQIPELKTANELPAKRTRVCAHGIDKGFHCWKCGGLAQVESAS